MALKDRIEQDRRRVFMNQGHFAEEHLWNGIPVVCVVDEETALKRKNNNVVDLAWDNNTTEKTVYVPSEDLPGRALPNEHILFDHTPMKVLQVNEDMGMLTITLVSNYPKAVNDL